MGRARIAIFSDRDSSQAAAVSRAVEREGGAPRQFDVQLGGAGHGGVIAGGDRLIWEGVDLAGYDAAHIRCTAPNSLPVLPAMLNACSYNDWRGGYLREQQFQATAYGFFDQLAARGCLVVNPLSGAYLDHNAKGQFYFKLAAWGAPVPETLLTSDPDAARDFMGRVGEVVVKPAVGIGSTRLVTAADLTRFDEVALCPVLFQAYLRGYVVRVHVVGDTVVLALRVRAEHVDSRTATEGFDYHAMPEAEQARLVAINRRLGLHYSAWDVMHTHDGRYVYLDCNPGPYIMWIGPEYVEVVVTQLARYLVAYAARRSVEDASSAVEPWWPRAAAGG